MSGSKEGDGQIRERREVVLVTIADIVLRGPYWATGGKCDEMNE